MPYSEDLMKCHMESAERSTWHKVNVGAQKRNGICLKTKPEIVT